MTAPLPPDPAEVLTRLEELHKAAAPGPWTPATAPSEDSGETHAEYLTGALRPEEGRPLWVAWAPVVEGLHDDSDYVIPVVTGDGPAAEANARFMAAAHDHVPALLAAVRRVLALAGELEAEGRAAQERSNAMPRTEENVRHHTAERRHARVSIQAADRLRRALAGPDDARQDGVG